MKGGKLLVKGWYVLRIWSNKGGTASFRVTFVGQSCHLCFQNADNTFVIWPLLLLTFWLHLWQFFCVCLKPKKIKLFNFLFYPLLAERLFCVWNQKDLTWTFWFSILSDACREVLLCKQSWRLQTKGQKIFNCWSFWTKKLKILNIASIANYVRRPLLKIPVFFLNCHLLPDN